MNALTDREIMLQVRDGEVSKLGLLFERHHLALYNYFVRQTNNRERSEDLVQDVFLRMLKYRHTYRGESEFALWMYRIARNAWVDHFRKNRRETRFNEEDDEPLSLDPIASENVEENQKINLLHAALAKLTPDKREVLVLSRFQEMKYEEIAQLLGCAVGTVKVRVHRALKDLREIYAGLTDEHV